MSYRDRLMPWCIIRHLPNAQNVLVERFRNRGEAEAYLRSLKQLLPQVEHSLVFDPDSDSNNPANLNPEPTVCNFSVLKNNPIDWNS
jgi:hypothetical protein